MQSSAVLTRLSTAPTAMRAVVACYNSLLASQSDMNVKMILLDRLLALTVSRHADHVRESLMDTLRVLTTPSLEIRRKVREERSI